MKKLMLALVLAGVGLSVEAAAQKNPMVGGAAMFRSKNIVENAVNSRDHTTLVAAVKVCSLRREADEVDDAAGVGRPDALGNDD